jgi:hypothetical protein
VKLLRTPTQDADSLRISAASLDAPRYHSGSFDSLGPNEGRRVIEVQVDWGRCVDIERFRALARVLMAPRGHDLAPESPTPRAEREPTAKAEESEAAR